MNGSSLGTTEESEVMAMEEAREAVGDYDLGWHDRSTQQLDSTLDW